MRILGNIIWHIPYLGFLQAFSYALIGCLFCLTIVGIPLGMGMFHIASMLLAPFSKGVVNRSDIEYVTEEEQSSLMKVWRIIIRILYFPFGLFTAIILIFHVVGMFFTIIGIPCALAVAKCIGLVFNPVGKVCVSIDVAEEIKRRKAAKIVDRMTNPNLSNNSANIPITETIGCNPEFMAKAGAKTDEELKQIISNRTDYHPMLVNAAEKVLLERITQQPNITPNSVNKEEAPTENIEEPNVMVTKETTNEVKDEITIEENEELVHPTIEPTVSSSSPTNDTKGKSNKGLIAVFGGIVIVTILIIGYVVWYIPYAKDRDALRTYVLATNVFLRSEQNAGVEYNVLHKAPYGSEIITYEKGTEWSTVKANGKKGYMASAYLLSKNEFDLLHGVWGDLDARDCIESSKCRLAILDFLKQNNMQSGTNGWQIFTKQKDVKPNSVFYPRLFNKNSKYTDFIFILKSLFDGNRMIVCYSFEDETEKPIFRFSEIIPKEGYIKNVSRTTNGAFVSLDNGESFNINF